MPSQWYINCTQHNFELTPGLTTAELPQQPPHPFHGGVGVVVSGSVFLTLHSEPRWQVSDPDGGIGRVHRLSAGSRRLKVGEFEILRLEFDARIGDGRSDDHDARRGLQLTSSLTRRRRSVLRGDHLDYDVRSRSTVKVPDLLL